MKIGKKSYVLLGLFLVASIFLLFMMKNITPMKALEKSEQIESPLSTTIKEDTERQMLSKNMEVTPTTYDASTDSELDQADAAYYAAKGNFNPDLKVATASNWTEFVRAYKDNTVTKIKLTSDIASQNIAVDGVSTTTFGNKADEYRKSSLVIDGGYTDPVSGEKKEYGLTLSGSKMLRTSDAPTGFTETAADGSTQNRSMFHLKDLSIAQPGTENANSYGFVGAPGVDTTVAGENVNAVYSKNWYFRLTNVNTDIDDNTPAYRGVARAIVGYQAEVTLAGRVELSTTGEPFYLGSLIVEPGTSFKGITEYSNYSVVWFVDRIDPKATAPTGELTIGKNSFVYLKNITNGASYPGFYGDYGDVVVDEGATMNIDMQGNAWRFDTYDSTVRVKKNATVNLISRGTGAVLTYGGGPGPFADGYNATTKNNSFIVEPEASFFAYGITGLNTGTIETQASSTNNSFILDSPKQFDIRNSTNNTVGNTGSYRAVNMYNSQSVANGRNSNFFEIIGSDISLWNNGAAGGSSNVDIDGTASEEYVKVAGFKMNSQNSNTYAAANTTPYPVATDSNFTNTLGKFNPTAVKRISGRNTPPEIIWTPVTDADKTLKARVYLGERPTGYDENGNTILVPVYAGKGEATVYFTDTFGNNYGPVSTDSNGYATVPVDFQTAGKQVTAHAERGPAEPNKWIGEDKSTTVIDITPPEPAVVTGDKVTNGMKQLIGKDAEPKAKIYVDINGTRQSAVGTVNEDGTWAYNLPRYLNTGETVQIFLEDNAGKITEVLDPAAPSTNSDNGNINPATEMKYRDATFKAATKYTVEDALPDKPLMEKTVVSSGGQTTQVGDVLTYTLTAKNNKAATFTTNWAKVVITDTLPAGLDFDPATADIKINDVTAVSPADYTYDSDSRVLTVNVGDLATGATAKVTFKATVAAKAVGTIITNEAEAIGDSPRETPFVEGPNDPNAKHETYSAKSLAVDNPGGTVFGVLELASAPTEIDFGSVKYQGKKTRLNTAEHHGADLIVKDSRANKKGWSLTAKMTTPMTSTTPDAPVYTLDGAVKYVYKNREITLNGGAQDIMVQDAVTGGSIEGATYNISDTWSESGDGFKFEVSAQDVKALGSYQGEILWELGDAP